MLQAALEDVTAALLPAACRRCGAALPDADRTAGRAARPYSALYRGTLRRHVAGPLSLPLALLCARCCEGLSPVRGAGALPEAPEIACVTAFAPAPALFELVHALKYEATVEIAPWLGAFLATALRRSGLERRGARLVPVPLHAARLAQRGYNQSALLARAVSHRLGVPLYEALLERRRATQPQARLDRALRRANVADAFVRRGALPEGSGPLILVDDVVTSGATAQAALAALGYDAARTCVLALCQARVTYSAPPTRAGDAPVDAA